MGDGQTESILFVSGIDSCGRVIVNDMSLNFYFIKKMFVRGRPFFHLFFM